MPANSLHTKREKPVDQVAYLALAKSSRLSLIRFVALAQFELGHRHGAIFAITLGLIILCEARAQNLQ